MCCKECVWFITCCFIGVVCGTLDVCKSSSGLNMSFVASSWNYISEYSTASSYFTFKDYAEQEKYDFNNLLGQISPLRKLALNEHQIISKYFSPNISWSDEEDWFQAGLSVSWNVAAKRWCRVLQSYIYENVSITQLNLN